MASGQPPWKDLYSLLFHRGGGGGEKEEEEEETERDMLPLNSSFGKKTKNAEDRKMRKKCINRWRKTEKTYSHILPDLARQGRNRISDLTTEKDVEGRGRRRRLFTSQVEEIRGERSEIELIED